MGRPFVAGVELDDFAVRSDERGGERVGDGGVGFVGETDVKILRERRQDSFAGDGEIPVGEGFRCGAAHVFLAVALEARGGIAVGIEAGAEQMGVGVEIGIGGERLFDDGKVMRDARAEIRQRAAGVDKSEQQRFTAKLSEVDRMAVLIDEVEIGDLIAGLRDMELHSRAVIGLGLADDDDVIEED